MEALKHGGWVPRKEGFGFWEDWLGGEGQFRRLPGLSGTWGAACVKENQRLQLRTKVREQHGARLHKARQLGECAGCSKGNR